MTKDIPSTKQSLMIFSHDLLPTVYIITYYQHESCAFPTLSSRTSQGLGRGKELTQKGYFDHSSGQDEKKLKRTVQITLEIPSYFFFFSLKKIGDTLSELGDKAAAV